MTEAKGSLNRMLGRWYPTDYVVGLLDSPEQAEQAFKALGDAGFEQDQIGSHTGEQVTAIIETFKKQTGPIERVAGHMQEAISTEGKIAKLYRDAAAKGYCVVMAHAQADDRIELARRVLAANGAHNMHHFGRWAVTDLPEGA
jgi:hypothetical protein